MCMYTIQPATGYENQTIGSDIIVLLLSDTGHIDLNNAIAHNTAKNLTEVHTDFSTILILVYIYFFTWNKYSIFFVLEFGILILNTYSTD